MTTMLAVIGSLEVLQFTKTLPAPIIILGNSSVKECFPLTVLIYSLSKDFQKEAQNYGWEGGLSTLP